jgi:vanillate O-demethylase monooxygenase subunit
MFLRNAWYVVACDHEVGRSLLARTICGEPIVLFRTQDGQPAALENRCCHRNAPLSAGKLIDDEVQCGYHGLVFNRQGRCVLIPSQTAIPPGAEIRAFPAVERHRWIWVWTGDPARADETLIPDLHWQGDPGWHNVGGYFHAKANYQALIDIQLDNTHAQYVHPTTLANVGAVRATPRVKREADAIRVERLMPDSDPQPLYVRASGFKDARADVWVNWVYKPPTVVAFDTGIAERGSGVFEGNRSRAFTFHNVHAITPENERVSHYFWMSSRSFKVGDEAANRIHEDIRITFREDLEMCEAQQACIDAMPGRPTIDINADNPTIQARNLLARMIEAERAAG